MYEIMKICSINPNSVWESWAVFYVVAVGHFVYLGVDFYQILIGYFADDWVALKLNTVTASNA